jgi:hypothetical protein
MRIIIQTVFVCLLFSLNGFAQIVDVKNSWNYFEIQTFVCGESSNCGGKFYQNIQYSFGNDTVINNKKYLALFETTRNNIDTTVSHTIPAGFLREEENHKKVYYFSGSRKESEILLYDFTLKKDSLFKIVQEFLINSDTVTNTVYDATVLKTDSILINGKNRLRIQFDAVVGSEISGFRIADTLDWIEGIGSRQDLLYIPNGNNGKSLLCFKHNNETEYVNNYGLDCLYSGPPNFVESFQRNDIKVYPNPVKNILSIQSEKPMHSIVLYRITGGKLDEYFPDDIFYQIALKSQRSGIYILSIDGNFRKIIVE